MRRNIEFEGDWRMKNEEMKVTVKTSAYFGGPLIHKISVTNIPLKKFKKDGENYSFLIKRKSKKQKLHLKISASKEAFKSLKPVKKKEILVKNNHEMDLTMETLYSLKRVIKIENTYLIKYTKRSGIFTFEIENFLDKDYYKHKNLPEPPHPDHTTKKSRKKLKQERIKIRRVKIKHNKKTNLPFPLTWSNKSKITQKDLLMRDLYYSEGLRYYYSPNSDGNRSKNEYFGGGGSNMYRSGK